MIKYCSIVYMTDQKYTNYNLFRNLDGGNIETMLKLFDGESCYQTIG